MAGEIVLLEASPKRCYLYKSNRLHALPRGLMKNHDHYESLWIQINTGTTIYA